jgi:catechol 2,3-dioxygenase-like lactoylglutathione lyase family enzyme
MLEGSNMRLNHLDLHVPDVAATTEFFTRYLGLKHLDTRANGGLAILTDGHGLEFVLSHALEKFGTADQSKGLVAYHIGFIVESRETVDTIHAAMLVGGIQLSNPPREIRGGYLFYVHAPGNILVEIAARELLS